MIANEDRPTPSSSGDRRAAADPLQQRIYAVTNDLQAPARHIRAFTELLANSVRFGSTGVAVRLPDGSSGSR